MEKDSKDGAGDGAPVAEPEAPVAAPRPMLAAAPRAVSGTLLRRSAWPRSSISVKQRQPT